jgi:hypothetical protein
MQCWELPVHGVLMRMRETLMVAGVAKTRCELYV